MRRMRYGVLIMLSLLWIGCGGSPPPHAALNSTQAAIRAANEVGTDESPRAALHLKYARDQYALAQQLVEKEENERAAMLLRRAEADADLALSLSREATSEKQAKETSEQVRELREELEGK
jgi:hypothetical protein